MLNALSSFRKLHFLFSSSAISEVFPQNLENAKFFFNSRTYYITRQDTTLRLDPFGVEDLN